MSQTKLGFVIGGAQKAGTTTLDAIFRRHPQVQMASIKETHFFDDESRDWETPDYGKLDGYFEKTDQRLRGEATPITLYWRPAIRRLHQYNPDIKFIFLLRNPVERAFSNWQHEYAAGREKLAFGDAIREKGRSRLRGAGEADGSLRYLSYIERGLYAQQLSYLMQYFPRRNFHCELSEEFFFDQSAALRRLAAFLGIDRFPDGIPELRLNAARDLVFPSVLGGEDAAYLSALFSGDIAAVETLLGRAIPEWKRAPR